MDMFCVQRSAGEVNGMVGYRALSRRCVVAAVVAAFGLVVGCTPNAPTSVKPSGTASSAASPSPAQSPPTAENPEETAKKQAIDTYLSHWKEVQKRYADKTGKAGDLKQYAASAALSQVEIDSENMRKKNVLILGTVSVDNPTAVSADINRKVPNVVISSCMDISRWRVVDAETQRPVSLPKERLLRYVIKATVEKWTEGWRVIRDEPQGKKC
ncbi:hypothetical protein ABZV60_23240 [Streptomyces sp. NPDC004787]|uniref:hypothetical protein n=1 Tax=Streptomyces sp. NPDC004787 TaxID=3154291 RepID=UPI0033B7F048